MNSHLATWGVGVSFAAAIGVARLLLALIFLGLGVVGPACAQLGLADSAASGMEREVPAEPISAHWAYASIFGTGWYEVDKSRSVFILDVPLRRTFGTAGLDQQGLPEIGWEFHYPVTLGLHQIDDLPGILDPGNFGSISFTPGVEAVVPINERWYLRPYLKAGMGFDLGSSERAWIYLTGIKSRYRMHSQQVTWDFLASANVAGFGSNKGASANILGGMVGMEASHQWPWSKSAVDTHWHLTYTRLQNGPEYLRASAQGNRLRNVDSVFELGLAFSPGGGRFKFWIYQPERLGLALQMSPDGDYFALRLNTRSWFTR